MVDTPHAIKRAHKISQALVRRDAAQARLERMVREVQAECPHAVVVETPFVHQEFFEGLNALRICPRCGMEEEGSVWSGGHIWTKVDYSPSVLGNTDTRLVVTEPSRERFYCYRIY